MNIILRALLILILCFFGSTDSSAGDQSPSFRACQELCRGDFECPVYNFAFKWAINPCFSCRQKCIWETVKIFKENNWRIPQFFGKWPFLVFSIPFFYDSIQIQEPASTLFSFLNLLAVKMMYNRIKNIHDDYRIKKVWLNYSYIGGIVWICSISFHSRDFWVTEYMDYFAACGLICYALFAALSFTIPWFQKSVTGHKM